MISLFILLLACDNLSHIILNSTSLCLLWGTHISHNIISICKRGLVETTLFEPKKKNLFELIVSETDKTSRKDPWDSSLNGLASVRLPFVLGFCSGCRAWLLLRLQLVEYGLIHGRRCPHLLFPTGLERFNFGIGFQSGDFMGWFDHMKLWIMRFVLFY